MEDTLEIHPEWHEHPMVKRAVKRSGDEGPLTVLVELHDIISEVEARFPGVPFRAVLGADAIGGIQRQSVQRTLRLNGASEADIALIAVDPIAHQERETRSKADRKRLAVLGVKAAPVVLPVAHLTTNVPAVRSMLLQLASGF